MLFKMLGKILVAAILIVFIVVLFNHLEDIFSLLKNTKFFNFNFLSAPISKKHSSSASQTQNQKLPFAITPGYKVKISTSSSVLKENHNDAFLDSQQSYSQYNQLNYDWRFNSAADYDLSSSNYSHNSFFSNQNFYAPIP